MALLHILNIFAELIHLVFQIGILTRKYLVPAGDYLYVGFERFIYPLFLIPGNYLMVRRMQKKIVVILVQIKI